MKLTFHGAAQTVTGSRHLIELDGRRLLLECGLFQGRRQETYARNLGFPFLPGQVDAVVLSHAHIDHCGNLPNLVRNGFAGRVHCTHATRHLTDLVLQDAGHIQESDAAFLNKKRLKRGESRIEPLYTVAHAQAVAPHLASQSYAESFEPIPGVQAVLLEAGHILGSAGVLLTLEEKGRTLRLMFSGDIGRRDMPILRDPVLPPAVDYLIMECTYGDTSHPGPQQAYEELQAVVARTLRRGGRVIIPAFAVGRTQLLVYNLHRMIKAGEMPRVPVFIDSPLATSVTAVFDQHPEFFDAEAQALMKQSGNGHFLGFDLLSFTRSVDESKALNERRDPMVIVSASGMAETGRILHHLRHNLHDPRNTILITSWMAPHTLGRRLVEGDRVVKIFGEEHPVEAEVAVINGLSAHAGQDFLLKYAQAARGSLRGVFLVHGEPAAAAALTEKLAAAGVRNVHYPAQGDQVSL